MLIPFFVFCFAFANSELTVDQYNQLINDFVATTQTYSYPTSYRDFLKGNYDLSRCVPGDFFDFIIIGGGSTGSVLANRLSEVSKWKILLLEAGGEENDFSDIPAMFDYLRLSKFNWGYKSVPQKNSLLGYVDKVQVIPRGRVLGGSSVINAMMYVRGNKNDYDKWGSNNPGWSYKDVLPYFIKSENSSVCPQDYLYHGHNGELNTETRSDISPIAQAFLAATEELGYNVLDYNGKNHTGFSTIQFTSIKGKRLSGAKAFIKPARTRSNLKILTDTFVTQILINKNVATGVKYITNGKVYCSLAKKEVILSAGAINSPQLLMLSGIGPQKPLSSLGIKVIKDLPVGQNMWDHIVFPLLMFTTNFTFPQNSQTELIEQYLNGKGPYTLPDAIADLGFENVYYSDKSVPDIEHIFRSSVMPVAPWEAFKLSKNIGYEIYDNLQKLAGKTIWQSYAMLLHPKSRGTITLKSKDPFDFPLIDPNYFSDKNDYDLNTLAASINQMLQISNTNSMKYFNSTPFKVNLPNCPSSTFGTATYNRCLVKYTSSTIHHYSGTCKMGPSSDIAAVVDNNLKLHGIERLRVADCSVIPVTIAGHTNGVAFMIGEKAADIIKKNWLK